MHWLKKGISTPISQVADITWPALPTADGARMLALQFQLEQSQWLPPAEILELQMTQLKHVLRHAQNTVAHYSQCFRKVGLRVDDITSFDAFRQLPILKREDIQNAAEQLNAKRTPREHGRTFTIRTSGSTGRPIAILGTDLTHFFWNVFTLREHLWHQRDFRGKLAVIRTTVTDESAPSWGPAINGTYKTGPCVMLNIRHNIDAQLAWLQQENPDYLLSHPSNLHALALAARKQDVNIPNLRGVRSFGEPLTLETRKAIQDAFGVAMTDVYSAEELGYIALQCPEHDHYHIQSESLLVEVLDAADSPCQPGETGRVVVTTLHNFATPLIRYEIMDYAEVGEPCPCGRGLPVLKRIGGRQRNLITLPDHTKHWPSFPTKAWAHIGRIRQIQLVQRDLTYIQVRLVAETPLTASETRQLSEALVECLGHPFQFSFQYFDQIPRSANFKYEDFISEIHDDLTP